MSTAPRTKAAPRQGSEGVARARALLLEAIERVPGRDLVASLADVARCLPVPAGVELVAIRLRDTDRGRVFHLVGMEGASPRERRSRAMNPLSLNAMKSMAALGPAHTASQAMALRALHIAWIHIEGEPAGTVFIASRTERPLTARGCALAGDVATRLGERLGGISRTHDALVEASRRFAREAAVAPEPVDSLESLRPRERVIVALYAEGVSVDEIARLLVISPHTVRTHVKNAFRRLGVHSRDDAARLLFADEVRRLL